LNDTYSLCIIDDMEDAVDSLVRNIPWLDYKIEVTGTATNGKEGLALVLKLKPDIVLTDIRMPYMDGLDMISSLLKEHPFCKVIIMSGYSDFEYAQKALRLGAIDYLTKPLTPQELGCTMDTVLEQLVKERQLKDQERQLEKRLHESMPLIKREQLNMLIRYETTREAALNRWTNLNLSLGAGRFVIMVAEIDNWLLPDDQIRIQEVEMVRFAIQNIWEETINETAVGIVFPDAYTNRIVSIVNASEAASHRKIGELSRTNIQNHSKYTVSIGVSDEVSIEHLPRAYTQALTALSYNFYTGGNCIFSFSDHQMSMMNAAKCESEKEKELLLSLRAGNAEKMVQWILQIVDSFGDLEQPLAPTELISSVNELLYLIKRELHEALPESYSLLIDQRISDLHKSNIVTVHLMKEQLSSICRMACGWIHSEQESEALKLINRAAEYMDMTLAENLTIGDYASHIHLSTSYFASLFKKTKGLTVHQYILKEKIGAAQKMLLQGRQVQEIAGALGFEDRRYFTEVFKKITGMTPTEFMRRYE
jgi:two-component system response regulator YesN